MKYMVTITAGTMAAYVESDGDELKRLKDDHGALWYLALLNAAQHDERRGKIVYKHIH